MPHKKSGRTTWVSIMLVEVEQLFRRYNYHLEVPRTESNDMSQIAILYGDNGTGKTTVLKLLFHLLSPGQGRGHRIFLAEIPFSRFSVTFSDGARIDVVREQPTLVGPYSIHLSGSGWPQLGAKIEVNEDQEVHIPPIGEQILSEIERRELCIFFLGDDRMLESDVLPYRSSEERSPRIRYREHRRRLLHRAIPMRRDIALTQSLERMKSWLGERLIQESTRGQVGAQQLYANIVRSLNEVGVPKTEDYQAHRSKFMEDLKGLAKQSVPMAEFGLMPKLNVKPLIQVLSKTDKKVLPFVAQVVQSFIDDQRVRLDALSDLSRMLYRFVTLVNGFLVDKRIKLDVETGISIVSDSKTDLKPENLSSGEKQLLLLFCNVLMSSQFAALFIIDEPEISLNVKWQRQLVDALIDITSGTRCQFLLATHSMELLNKHRNVVIKLGKNQS